MLTKENIKNIYRLSPMQEGMFYHFLVDKTSPAYFEQYSYRLHGNLNIALVKKSLEALFNRYDILRTVFVERSGKLLQVVLKEREIDFYYEDISLKENSDEYLAHFKTLDKERSFDLTRDILMRVGIFQLNRNENDAEYELIWSYHHILMDGWCIGILISEFLDIYKTFLENRPHGLPGVTQYRTYIKWLEDQDKELSKAYWQQVLAHYEVCAGLPGRQAGNTNDAGYIPQEFVFYLEEEKTRRVNAAVDRCQVTLNTLFQATWAVLLAKYSAAEDVVFGAVVSGRPSGIAGIERMVGLFINTIPVRVQYKGKTTFLQLLNSIQEQAIEGQTHHYLSLAEIQSLGPLKQNLLDHILAFENYPIAEQVEGLESKGNSKNNNGFTLRLSNLEVVEQTHYNLNVVAAPGPRLMLKFMYNAHVYSRIFLERITRYFVQAISQVLENQAIAIEDIDLLSGEEKRQLIYELNDTEAKYPKDRTIHQLFEEQAARTPDNIAVICPAASMTYKKLNEKSDLLAGYLASQGVKENHPVAVMMERSSEMIVGMLGILKAGGAYLPIDPDYPGERIDYMLKDSGAGIVLTNLSEGHRFNCHSSFITLHSSDLAYILYTSGTTGRPKGVMIEHINVVRLFFTEPRLFDFNQQDVWTMFHSYCFDFSVWEMYGALLFGGKLIIIPKMVARDPQVFLPLLRQHRVTVLNQTPSAFYSLVNEELNARTPDLCLRYVIFGGEALNPLKLKEWQKKYPQIKLINMFGITETTVHVTYKEITAGEIQGNVSNIGTPIPTLCTYLFDANLKLVPVSAPGELHVGGRGVGRGYLNKPELTHEKFIKNPVKKGERLYKSGDLAKLLEHGEMEYLGRKDLQVQIKGFRVELGEIENQLLQHEEIKEVVVIAKEDKDNNKLLCAYVVADEELPPSHLREFLSKRLPDYMLPAYFVPMPRIPLTSNGKLDKKRLPEPGLESGGEYVPPGNPIEKELVDIWKEILELEEVGTADNFFVFGGDSIKAIRVISLVNNKFDAGLKVVDLFTNETIRQLADVITRKQEENVAPGEREDHNLSRQVRQEMDALKQRVLESGKISGAVRDIFPMSDIEKGMIFHAYTNPEEAIYHDQFVYQRRFASFDPGAFKEALQWMAEKHPILRTGYSVDEFDAFVHFIYKEVPTAYRHEDISHWNPSQQEQHIKHYMEKDRQNRWDISSPPLWRMATFTLGGGNTCAVWTFHHAILDGWSNASLLTELNNAYLKVKAGETLIPEKLKINYKDFIFEEMTEKRKAANIDFWKKELQDYKRLSFLEPGSNNAPGEIHDFLPHFEPGLHEKVIKASREYNISLKNICFAAYIYMLNMVSYENEVTAGLITNNRPEGEDGDKLLGCFLNTMPFRFKFPGSMTWRDYIHRVDRKLVELKQYEKMTFYEIVKVVGERHRRENPVFDTIFNYVDFHIFKQVAEDTQPDDAGENQRILVQGYERTNTLFDFNMTPHSQGIFIGLRFSTSVISDEAVKTLYGYFESILNLFTTHPDRLIKKHEVVSSEERQKLLAAFNDTGAEYPEGKTIHELFEEQVSRAPDNIAVSGMPVHITYKQLNEKSNQIVSLLMEKGIQPETIVGLMVERSVEMITGILGILKAGGAYLPIEPGYPEERIRYLLTDSRAGVLLSKVSEVSKVSGVSRYCDVIDLNEISKEILKSPTHPLTDSPTQLCYLIYTSGSTGKPKGVGIKHASLVNRLNWMQRRYPLEKNDTILQKTPFTFDVSVWELLWWAVEGARVCFLVPGGEKDPAVIAGTIEQVGITIIHFVPSMLNAFLEYVRSADAAAKLSSLKQVFASGEALTLLQVKAFAELLHQPNGTKLANLYGPTEAAIDVTYFDCTTGEDLEKVPIGKPIDNVQIFILSREQQVQPIGVPGELCIAGVGLARGYINRPELTAEKFIGFHRSYRTGDLARWLPDGNIEFLGRIDHQVKIRGFRVEPEEIEVQLLRHEQIKEAVVTVKGNGDGNASLCAYIVSAAGSTSTVPQLKAHLAEQLPDYMLPSVFIKVDRIPLTPNGKVDRRTLDLYGIRVSTGKGYVSPKNKTEKVVADVWKDVLHLEKVSIHDNFFDLGGDSLAIMKVTGRIGNIMKSNIAVVKMYQYPTVHAFANYLDLNPEEGKPTAEQEHRKLEQMEDTMKETVQLFDEIQSSEG